MVNRLFELSTTFTKLAPLTTDYGKASMNSAVMAELESYTKGRQLPERVYDARLWLECAKHI